MSNFGTALNQPPKPCYVTKSNTHPDILLALTSKEKISVSALLDYEIEVLCELTLLSVECSVGCLRCRFVDALTPTLASLHPLSVLNHLHAECVSSVCAANILKHDQSLSYLSQLQASSKRSTAERAGAAGAAAPAGALAPGPGPHVPSNTYEECIYTQTQGTVILPKVPALRLLSLCKQNLGPRMGNIRSDYSHAAPFKIY